MRRPFVFLLLAGSALFAQQNGRLSGSVVDPVGAALPNATVRVYLPDGTNPLLLTTTNSEGIFDFIAVRPELYRLEVEAPNFSKFVESNIRVESLRHIALPEIRLSLAATAQSIEVTASVTPIDTAGAEVSTTITKEQVRNLPVLDRQAFSLFTLQAGVSNNSRTSTVVNGMRPTYTNLYVEGINVQDIIRTNSSDYIPNRITIEQVAEISASTTNSSPTIGGAASTMSIIFPSGANQLHGSAYWYNRNNATKANDWFNNLSGVPVPALNLNQFGGVLGGPIKRDKLFFWANYEGLRKPGSTPASRTILTPTARQGILQYRAGGEVRQFNVLQAAGLQPSAFMQDYLAQVPAAANNATIGDGLNTTGYRFNARDQMSRNNVTGKLDYNLATRHVFSASFAWNRETVDRPDLGNYYSFISPVYNDNGAKLFSVSHRWTPTSTLTNELRGGFNRAHALFLSRDEMPQYLVTGTLYTSPQNTRLPEGRNVNWYGIYDNANWIKGRHSISFGVQTFQMRNPSYGFAGTIPSYALGLSAASPYGFNLGNIPGADATFTARANSLLTTLAGLLNTGTQTFNITGRTSGFVPGAAQRNNWNFNNYALYVQDNFKLDRRFTLTLGLRWDYFSPVNERDALVLQPVVQNGNAIATLLGNSTLDFSGNAVGRPMYKRDLNNFGPNVAIAWDPFGDGKTSFRAGYSVAFLNDNTLNTTSSATAAVNSGLRTARGLANLIDRADAPPTIAAPPFAIPTTAQAQFDLSPNSPPVQGLMDPNLATPYVQQWNASLQRDLHGWVFEARYVANHAVKGFRQIDFNQVNVFNGGFLQDFVRARNNGFAALNSTGTFNPNYNANIPGSQPLTFFPQLPSGGWLTNSTVLNSLRTGEVGTLAQTYQGIQAFPANQPGFSYFPNPLTLYSSMLTNLSNSTYNAGQFEVRKRTRNGLQFQANYTFSRALTNTLPLRSLDAQLDNANPKIEKGLADFDQRHAFKFNHYYPLPFGASNKLHFSNRGLDRLIDGWGLSGFLAVYSGSPVGVLSNRGTLNRGARSLNLNTVDTNLTYPELREITGFFQTGNGPYWIEPSHVNPATNTGVAPDGAAPFAGQVFFNPQPGSLGSLQRRVLQGPGYWNYDLALSKITKITERQSIELHVDAYNVFNHPNFYLGDQNVNAVSFGRILGQNYNNAGIGPRLLQFGLYYRF